MILNNKIDSIYNTICDEIEGDNAYVSKGVHENSESVSYVSISGNEILFNNTDFFQYIKQDIDFIKIGYEIGTGIQIDIIVLG